ncbi:MAG: class I SAM-dependent methyltransferase [Nanoarchaeota archaeon]
MDNLDNWRRFKAKTTPAVVPLANEFYDDVPVNSRVVDFGCAWGRISFELYDQGYSVVGFDINENEIACARQHAKEISALESKLRFDVGNATNLPYPDRSFDAGVMVAFMVTIVDPQARTQVLKEAYRILRDGGVLYISDFGQTWNNEKYRRRYEEHFPITKEKGTFIVTDSHDIGGKELYRCHHYTEEELRSLIEPHFKIVSWKETEFTTPSGNVSNGFKIIASK